MSAGATARVRQLIETARADHSLPPLDESTDVEALAEQVEDGARYLLLERGHYGQTFVSAHRTPQKAGDYTLNQEYAEDWSAEALIDTETGEHLLPRGITWAA